MTRQGLEEVGNTVESNMVKLNQACVRLNNEIEKYSIFMSRTFIPSMEKGDKISDDRIQK